MTHSSNLSKEVLYQINRKKLSLCLIGWHFSLPIPYLRIKSSPPEIHYLLFFLQVSLPGQVGTNSGESELKVIVPSKYKEDEKEEESPFSRKDKLRASFKDQMAKRYNNKKDVTSMLQKLQATAASMYTHYC